MKVNMNEVISYEVIEGIYEAKVLSVMPEEKNDKQIIKIKFELLEGENAGKKISKKFFLTPKAFFMFVNFVKVLVPEAVFPKTGEIDALNIANQLVGLQCRLDIKPGYMNRMEVANIIASPNNMSPGYISME